MVSTKGRYALRVMLDLAQHAQNTANGSAKFIPLEEIAERQEISKKYLEIILKVLVRHNILQGLRGKGGGYRLTRLPQDYSVGEILTLTEGNMAVVSCLAGEDNPCARKSDCLTFPMWEKFNRLQRDFFFGITLADLLNGKLA